MIKMVGYRLLVKPDEIERTTAGGIVLVQDERMAEAGQQFGHVVSLGSECWNEYEDKWCKIGDRIIFSKYAGRTVYDPETKEESMVILDTDVIGVIE